MVWEILRCKWTYPSIIQSSWVQIVSRALVRCTQRAHLARCHSWRSTCETGYSLSKRWVGCLHINASGWWNWPIHDPQLSRGSDFPYRPGKVPELFGLVPSHVQIPYHTEGYLLDQWGSLWFRVFRLNIYPHLCKFLGVSQNATLKILRLRETVKQANAAEDLSALIENYEELKYCFRYSDVTHFAQLRDQEVTKATIMAHVTDQQHVEELCGYGERTWSILLPICSRTVSQEAKPQHSHSVHHHASFNTITSLRSHSRANAMVVSMKPDGTYSWNSVSLSVKQFRLARWKTLSVF